VNLKLGFIGLGKMGAPMSRNLLKKGFELTVYDIRKEAVEQIVSAGARAASSIKEVAEVSEVILTSLPTPSIVEEVILGTGGVLDEARKGSVIIDTSTVSPSTSRKIAVAAEKKGVEALDAPVSGGPYRAAEGTLTVMVGGKKEVYERCLDIFRAIGTNIFYTGPAGSGTVTKLINNLMSLGNVIVMCEAIILGIKAGVPWKILHQVISTGTGRSYALEWKLPNLIAPRKFEGGFPIDLACKDLSLITDLAKELDSPLFVGSIVEQLYRLAKNKKLGDKDHTAVSIILQEIAGVEIKT